MNPGLVLVDQDRCRGWRFCVSGCPYKKVHFNPISVLAGARDLTLPAGIPVVRATSGFVEGFTFALWAFGTWWIPLLVILGLWRHVREHWPLSYEPPLWSVVFPLGMYSVAMLTFGKVAHLAFMEPLARVMFWVAVAVWALVALAFIIGLTRPGHDAT